MLGQTAHCQGSIRRIIATWRATATAHFGHESTHELEALEDFVVAHILEPRRIDVEFLGHE
jgi:hypothetical protein